MTKKSFRRDSEETQKRLRKDSEDQHKSRYTGNLIN